jgi:hypothetical protein
MHKSTDDTAEHSFEGNPPAWLRQCASGEILWLGQEAVVFFRMGKQGVVLVQRNAWSAGPHEHEWVSAASLQPLRDKEKSPGDASASSESAATGYISKTLSERS